MEDRYICAVCSCVEQPFPGKCPRCGIALGKANSLSEIGSCCFSPKKIETAQKNEEKDVKIMSEPLINDALKSPSSLPWYKRILAIFSFHR